MVEVAVAAVAEAMPRHVDRGAEAARVEQRGQLARLALAQQPRRDREAARVELLAQLVSREAVGALPERGIGCSGGHPPATAAPPVS
jgi:hypothetical protein